MDADLPDLMTTGGAAGATVARWAERLGIPLASAQQQYLEKQRTLRTRMEDLTSTIRLARSGQTLTAAELSSAERYMPAAGDSVTELRVKLKELKKIADKVRRRSVDVVDPKKGIRAERPAREPPPPPPPTGQAAPAGRPAAPGGDVPEPPPGMLMPDYARMLHRNGFSIKEARRLAQEKYEQP
jgi:hypothetical protein